MSNAREFDVIHLTCAIKSTEQAALCLVCSANKKVNEKAVINARL
jgi:hypothetical protein